MGLTCICSAAGIRPIPSKEDIMKDKLASRNRINYSIGTIGRDMQYTLVSMFLNVFLTEVLNLPDKTLWWTTGITLAVRVYDAVNDPLMGVFVDNTRTRFGKFKPWIAIGSILSALFTVLFFLDFGFRGTAYILSFTFIYLLWEVTFSGNDIGYWSMLPSLSIDQKTREKIGASARICANIGLFITVVAILPITGLIGSITGDDLSYVKPDKMGEYHFSSEQVYPAGEYSKDRLAITLTGIKTNYSGTAYIDNIQLYETKSVSKTDSSAGLLYSWGFDGTDPSIFEKGTSDNNSTDTTGLKVAYSSLGVDVSFDPEKANDSTTISTMLPASVDFSKGITLKYEWALPFAADADYSGKLKTVTTFELNGDAGSALSQESMGGGRKTGFLIIAIAIVCISMITQCFTVFGVKEQKTAFKQEEKTTLRELFRAIVKNDQLLFTLISMALFMIGYTTTTSFGTYFFIYAFKDEGMYSIFAAILGVSQLLALSVFPFFSKKFTRKQLYLGATILVFIGYTVFFLAPMNMIFIGAAGIPLFVGQAFIQLLMLMFLADTIEYGQWKLGKRNESVTFSVQPFINKIGGAVGNAIVGAVVILSGISAADGDPNKVSAAGLWMMKSAMLVFPLIIIVLGFIIYKFFFKIDKEMYDKIIADLKDRGDIAQDAK